VNRVTAFNGGYCRFTSPTRRSDLDNMLVLTNFVQELKAATHQSAAAIDGTAVSAAQ
jgi:hypothetical protein